ncbi:probable BOI-related E3 ubiquitin-protein ligase 2 isoform X2 [Benincasa hispida]|uniref:probable BOI-related E3 ubiquitin-protein ligase 2 isoform X2 n=1 Tax=Benincasa hispida TaxID=102211 RepID=UPI0018FFB8C5|nr:probable BOI-related E3 ubiquitin-protein ligase 2 isoform X2 [Benincasa hispida]
MGYGSPLTAFNANATAVETAALFPPMDSFPAAVLPASTGVVMKSDSGITYNLPIPRKRGREHHNSNRFVSYPSSHVHSQKNCGCNLYFLGEDISIQIQQQQIDVDRLISQHMERVKMELEEKQKREARRILEVIEIGMMRILRSKEEEIEKIGKLNWELEERVNCLSMENQLWRDVAETNEATANALRSNLEQVLLQVNTVAEEEEDAESCCGSNDDGGCGGGGGVRKKRKEGDEEEERRCKKCWKEESCVLLLPCRHLCLCTVCASSLHTCPICNSTNNASVRVIMP